MSIHKFLDLFSFSNLSELKKLGFHGKLFVSFLSSYVYILVICKFLKNVKVSLLVLVLLF
jgi:hypothetical protein